MSDTFSLELLRVFIQSNRPLWTVCDDCGADVAPQIDMTPDGPRTVVGMCACGFLTPGALVVEVSSQPAKEAAGESVEAA